ncbi:hypothetical protein H4Q32_028042 [Labeo rohita]|uniref:C2H2-type domain-containing protein n=1 Tax=Labeo rohita TaxID=84645 RepID=A0ABQ8L265_LABRO|nr:hypothetical protein H4Q32_028042 [Labeo rohita]
MAKLNQRVWNNSSLTEKTRLCVYQACILSTLLYGSETWTTYARHERKLNSFHMRCLRRILQIKWQDRVPNTEVLERANMSTLHAVLSERRLRWLGHVKRMDAGRIPKDLLYGELVEGQSQADDRPAWRHTVRQGALCAEAERNENATQKRRRKQREQQLQQKPSAFTCTKCGRNCHSQVGLHSHSRLCK